MGKKGTGRSVKGGGKARQNRDHRRDSQRGSVKGRWDDIVAAEKLMDLVAAESSGNLRAAIEHVRRDLRAGLLTTMLTNRLSLVPVAGRSGGRSIDDVKLP